MPLYLVVLTIHFVIKHLIFFWAVHTLPSGVNFIIVDWVFLACLQRVWVQWTGFVCLQWVKVYWVNIIIYLFPLPFCPLPMPVISMGVSSVSPHHHLTSPSLQRAAPCHPQGHASPPLVFPPLQCWRGYHQQHKERISLSDTGAFAHGKELQECKEKQPPYLESYPAS
jgi:hypothetical protein